MSAEQQHLFVLPSPVCQRVGCKNHATVRVHIDYGATHPTPAMLCIQCADAHQRGDEIPIRYNPEIANIPY
jgi:hypothetical protein